MLENNYLLDEKYITKNKLRSSTWIRFIIMGTHLLERYPISLLRSPFTAVYDSNTASLRQYTVKYGPYMCRISLESRSVVYGRIYAVSCTGSVNEDRKRPFFFLRLSPYFSVYGRIRPCVFDLGCFDQWYDATTYWSRYRQDSTSTQFQFLDRHYPVISWSISAM